MAKVGFVHVSSGTTTSFKEKHIGDSITSSDAYYNKIAFLDETNEIATHGQIYGQTIKYQLLSQEEYDALETKDDKTLYLIKETE